MSDLHHLSAVDVLEGFRTKAISPTEAFEAVRDRAHETEPIVNALIERDHEDWAAQAAAATERWARGVPRGPLDGLPIVLKEEQAIAGRSWCMGSYFLDEIAEETHPVAERVLAAGAIVHARTTEPEFSCAGFTHSNRWGVTRNPWNPDFTPGGSSGGSGAALASGTAYLASGSDIGGSIRIPASFCGVVGFKAPYGRVPGMPPYNLDTYSHDGAMARTVADTALFHNLIQGRHDIDHVSLPPQPIPGDLGDVRGMRVALAVTLGDFPVEPRVEENTRAVGAALRSAGATVVEVAVPLSHAEVYEAVLTHYGTYMAEAIGGVADLTDERLSPYARHFVERTQAVRARTTAAEGMELEARIQAIVAGVFADHDVLVCPTVGGYGFPAGDDLLDGVEIAGRSVDFHLMSCFTPVFNVAARHPVLNVPSGLAPNGVPTGVQIVGRPYDDVTPFRVGAAVERELGLWLDESWRPSLTAPAAH